MITSVWLRDCRQFRLRHESGREFYCDLMFPHVFCEDASCYVQSHRHDSELKHFSK